MTRFTLAIIATALAHAPVHADWSLDDRNSEIYFVSVKAVDIAEVHHFTRIAGTISDKGKAAVSVDLASVETGIPIRNERMQTLLFETDDYPSAVMRTTLDKNLIDDMLPGSSKTKDLEFTLELHGQEVSMTIRVRITRLGETAIIVSSVRPVLLAAESVDLVAGVEELRKVVNLPSISNTVPITFSLTFTKNLTTD